MIDPKLQQLRVSVEFHYAAEVFEGDPTDAYQIAALEMEALQTQLQDAIDTVVGETRGFIVRVVPA
jgi:hypothetical protein